ncbi:peptide/nickel transport system substrate-binding protein [Mesorhizobium sp. J18]|uniref:ABC transporter substrate-binding protein n=1 Tax=Mesorhizobium sp. J18 TaxID=935263 RepID=UPI00119B24EC|nr:ABC transporter substrate-binding protein [Mesorhizobium sp. J18]TWG99724.1 peptide/nickel transport system substrate-binding protein [Mesorhizobium sp. J18]
MSDELAYLGRRVVAGKMSRRDFLGRAAALGVAAPFANMILANTAGAQTPKKGGALKMGLVGGESTNSLDPALWLTQVPQNFGSTWGELLVVQSPEDGSPQPVLAESWEASDDAAEWHFKIRKGITFHNGKDLTPDDVVQTITRHADEATKSAALGVLGDIDTVTTDGDYVVFKLKRGNADLPLLLTDYHLVIQPNGGRDKPDEGIGTGPYKVEVNEPGVRHMSVKYDGYWRDDVGHVDSVEVIVMNDNTARMSALQSGQVHIINRVEPKTVSLLERVQGVVIEAVPSKGHYVFIMHCNTAPFDNADLRMALKYAVDRQQMIDQILLGHASLGNDFPINQSYALFPEGIEQRAYDPEKAAFHYKKSGHSGPILLRTSEVAFPGAVDAAQLFQQQAQAAGIQIDVQREPGDGYWTEVWNKQPFCASYWGGRPTQDSMYSTAYITDADWNDTRFFNEGFDKIILEARAELDDAKRAELYREAATMVRDDGGLILPMFNDFLDAHREEVKGWVKDPNHETSNLRAAIRVWLDQA